MFFFFKVSLASQGIFESLGIEKCQVIQSAEGLKVWKSLLGNRAEMGSIKPLVRALCSTEGFNWVITRVVF